MAYKTLKTITSSTNSSDIYKVTIDWNDSEQIENKPEFKTINGESILGSGNIEIEGGNGSIVDSNGFSVYGTRMIANPKDSLEGLTVACMGDSITQGTSLGDPTTEKATDANGQKYPAITNEELATTTPAGVRGKSYVYYLGELGLGITTTNLGTTGWTLSTGTAAPSKISGSSIEKWATGVPTCLELPSNFVYGTDGSATDLSTKFTSESSYPKVFTLMMGVNDFSKEAPLGQESSLYKDGALNKILTYELRYIYTDINGNIVDNKNNPITNPKSYIDDENKIIYCFTNEVWGAWEYAALKLIKFFSGTDTKIYFMTPPLYRGFLYEGVGPDNTNHQGYYFGEVIDVIIKTAYKYRIPVLDNYHMCGITPENAEYYLGDKVHPNFRGHILLANQIAEFLKLNPTIMSNSLLTPQSGRWTGWTATDTPEVPDEPDTPDEPTETTVTYTGYDELAQYVKFGNVQTNTVDDTSSVVTIAKDETSGDLIFSQADDNGKYTVSFLNIPLTVGSEVTLTAKNYVETMAPNIMIGIDSDVSAFPVANTWKNQAGTAYIAASHIYIQPSSTTDKNSSYLERGTNGYQGCSPTIGCWSVTASTSDYTAFSEFTLKVLDTGFAIYKNNSLLATINNSNSNTYLDNTELPAYFMISCASGNGYKISIKSVKVVQN